MPDEIAWTDDVQAAVRGAAHRAAPRECALLLGGPADAAAITMAVELPNAAAGNDAFDVRPEAFLRAEQLLRDADATFVGFAHSHPQGACAPSARDRAELWTGCVQLITDGDEVRAFWLDADRRVRELSLQSMEASR